MRKVLPILCLTFCIIACEDNSSRAPSPTPTPPPKKQVKRNKYFSDKKLETYALLCEKHIGTENISTLKNDADLNKQMVKIDKVLAEALSSGDKEKIKEGERAAIGCNAINMHTRKSFPLAEEQIISFLKNHEYW